jgi:hypothetical protein
MEILDVDFELDNYLVHNGWVERNRVWRKSLKSLYFTKNGLMIALNNKEGVKHKHIVTCETPCDFFEAEIIFRKCRLNFLIKENGTENEH